MFHKDFISQIAQAFVKHKQTIAVAESVTAGLLQFALSSADSASIFFQGGLTAYNIKQKYTQLHVNLQHAIACNCVSEQVAAEMALGVAKLFSTDWAIAVTGYASPIPQYDLEDMYACFAVVFKNEVVLKKTITTQKKETEEVQRFYVNEMLAHAAALTAQLLQE
jgi:PncC family amidohydrolase